MNNWDEILQELSVLEGIKKKASDEIKEIRSKILKHIKDDNPIVTGKYIVLL